MEADDDFQDTSYFDNTHLAHSDHFATMSNPELIDTSTIPGWELIHSPPGKLPKGALVGKVVSTKMMKTVNVAVDRYKIVPIYRKRVRYTHKFFAHDEAEVANVGDLVMIVPCHRISKHKHFMLREIVNPKGQL
jgi:small subunit ribosomal protein S17